MKRRSFGSRLLGELCSFGWKLGQVGRVICRGFDGLSGIPAVEGG